MLILGLAALLSVAPSTQHASKDTAAVLGLIAFVGALWVWCAFVREWRHMTDKIRRLEEQLSELRHADTRDKAETPH